MNTETLTIIADLTGKAVHNLEAEIARLKQDNEYLFQICLALIEFNGDAELAMESVELQEESA